MYSDNTYVFKVHEYQEYRHEKNEIFKGAYHFGGDSIVFSSSDFDYVSAETAKIRSNYIEFLGGKKPFKMKIVRGWANNDGGIDTVKYKDYSFFTYDTAFYHIFLGQVTPYDLTEKDLVKIEDILKSCAKGRNLRFELKDYFTQCISVKNKNNEREVWINLLCNPKDVEKLKYFVIRTDDGGDCYFNVKINLNKGACYDFWVDGHA
jgi:hypothetical protein